MDIKQFEDKHLAQYGYAIHSGGEVALIDPARDPEPYYAFARQHQAKITAIIETHPHADFVSSHLDIAQSTGATIYVHSRLQADYPHQAFDEGSTIKLGKVTLRSLFTPGHSPDSISVLLLNGAGQPLAVFTGDSLFIGDCGRPDLREKAGAITAQRKELAGMMYHTLRDKFLPLPDEVKVYPAHGAGSLCGKGMSSESVSTIGAEKVSNWSLQKMSEEDFVQELLKDQPFVPKYFPFDVALNRKGAPAYAASLEEVPRREPITCSGCAASLDKSILVVDTRQVEAFRQSHLENAINIMHGNKFETWLGSIISPDEPFYLAAADEASLEELIRRTASIGYEAQIALAFVVQHGTLTSAPADLEQLRENPEAFTIVDVRNPSEVKEGKVFGNALTIPLYELRERVNEIPSDKPVVVHCVAGYRSAAAASILQNVPQLNQKVYDLGEAVKAVAAT